MTDPYDPPRPRDYALQAELDSLHQQEREGHATPEEQRRARELERRLHADERAAEARERQEHDRETGHEGADQAERNRHRR
jgi:hypothetical protein